MSSYIFKSCRFCSATKQMEQPRVSAQSVFRERVTEHVQCIDRNHGGVRQSPGPGLGFSGSRPSSASIQLCVLWDMAFLFWASFCTMKEPDLYGPCHTPNLGSKVLGNSPIIIFFKGQQWAGKGVSSNAAAAFLTGTHYSLGKEINQCSLPPLSLGVSAIFISL